MKENFESNILRVLEKDPSFCFNPISIFKCLPFSIMVSDWWKKSLQK
jgi:hypothetical protein